MSPRSERKQRSALSVAVVQAMAWALTFVAALTITIATTVAVVNLGGGFLLIVAPSLIFIATGMAGANWALLRSTSARLVREGKGSDQSEE